MLAAAAVRCGSDACPRRRADRARHGETATAIRSQMVSISRIIQFKHFETIVDQYSLNEVSQLT
jgi:hypothetical protein